ncbi:ribosomal L7Ae/L30e/S12e/Gadd45 family protein [Clostridium oceanicum]|uniref:50S ribosomal protein L7ae-like protein n=1 Tax=Clostridium oceanicum TaxID=1543 RepID=A0ABN1JBI1_9CLOT
MESKFFQFLGIVKKSGNLVEGYNKCEEHVVRNKVSLVILSGEASLNTQKKFTTKCKLNEIPLLKDYDSQRLSDVLGRESIKVLAVKDKNMANKLLELSKA